MLRDYNHREDQLTRFYFSSVELLSYYRALLLNNELREDQIESRLFTLVYNGVEIAICEYSLGYSFAKIRTTVEIAIEDYTKTAHKYSRIPFGVYSLINLVSLAILVEVDEHHWNLLAKKWQSCGGYGHFLARLVKYRTPTALAGDDVTVNKYFKKLFKSFEIDDPVELMQELKTYAKKWYLWHKGLLWYNAHNDDYHKSYFGYWCIEAAAVAKIRGIDLTGSTLGEYFPYSFFGMEEQLSKAKIKKQETQRQ
jgi:hypothetical protein